MTDKDNFIFKLKGKRYGGRLDNWVYRVTKELSSSGDVRDIVTKVLDGDFDDILDQRLLGIIYDSPKDNFEDGDIIITSPVEEIHVKDDQLYIAETWHSYFYLGDVGGEEDRNRYYMHVYRDKDTWM